MLQGLSEGLTGSGVPQPCRPVIARGEDRLAVWAEGDVKDGSGVGENRPGLGVNALPGGQAGKGCVPPAWVVGCDCRAPALNKTEQAGTDFPPLASGLAALVMNGR